MRLDKLWAALLAGAGLGLALPAGSALAQGTDAPAGAREAILPGAADDEPEESPLGIELGVDYTTAYFFRGYNIEDTGYIFQPYADVSYTIDVNENFSLTPHVGVWNSIHENPGPDDDFWDHLFETDVYGGVAFGFGAVTFDVSYYLYASPAGAFDETYEIDVTLSYDDAEWAEDRGLPFSFQPYVLYAIETEDNNGENDEYLEVGVEPSFEIEDLNGLTLSVPVAVGMSPDGFYLEDDGTNEFLGYVSVGLSASYPLWSFDDFGEWSITGSLTYLSLFADSLEAANDNGEDYELIGTVGLGISL